MSNIILQDRIGQLAFYHREYENYVKKINLDSPFFEKAKRLTLIALPFISLYKPFTFTISFGMNFTRSLPYFIQTKKALTKGRNREIALAVLQSGIAVAAIGGITFKNFYGMTITSGHRILTSFYETIQHLKHSKYEKAFVGLLYLVSNSLYLTMLLHRSLEIIALSLGAQALIKLYKSQSAFRKFKNGDAIDFLDGVAGLSMAGIRGNQMRLLLKNPSVK